MESSFYHTRSQNMDRIHMTFFRFGIFVKFSNSGSTQLNSAFEVDVALSAEADFGSAIDFVFMVMDFTASSRVMV